MSSQDYKYLFIYLQNGNNKDLHNIQSLLKSARVDINIDNGKLLLMALEYGTFEMIELLLNSGLKIKPETNALWYFIKTRKSSDIDIPIIELLLSYGENVDGIGIQCPIAEAIYSGKLHILKYLLENGANPNVKTGGNSNLELAIFSQRDDIIDLLLKYGALPWNYDYNCSDISLRNACAKSNVRVVKILLGMGSDPNKHNILHDIIYEYNRGNPAERDIRLEIIKLLMVYGANPMLEYCGKNALEYAEETDNAEIIDMVQQQMRFFVPFTKINWLFDFRVDRPKVYGACSAVLLVGERLYRLEDSDGSRLRSLPNEIWLMIMSFLEFSDMGNIRNTGSQRLFDPNRVPALPMAETAEVPTLPAEERVDPGSFTEDFVEVPHQLPEGVSAVNALPEIPGNNQDEEYGNLNNGSNGSWEKVNSPTRLERGMARFGAKPHKNVENPFLGGGKKDKTKLFNMVNRILKMNEEELESNIEMEIGLNICQLDTLTDLMENMIPEGIYQNPLFKKLEGHIMKKLSPKTSPRRNSGLGNSMNNIMTKKISKRSKNSKPSKRSKRSNPSKRSK